MQPDKFRYSLTIGGTEYNLKNAPDGWEETILNYKRSPNYWGLIRSFTVPLTFVLDGAWLLRREFYTKKLKAQAVLKVEALRNESWTYRLVYEGEVDFAEFKELGNSVTVNVSENGIAEAVTSRDKNVYEFSLADPKAVQIEVPSVSLVDVAQLLVLPQAYSLQTSYNIFPIDVVENQLINQKVATQIIEEGSIVASLASSDSWFLLANIATQVTISGILEAFVGITQLSDRVYIEVRNQSNELKGTLAVYLAGGQIEQYRIDYSLTMSLEQNEKLFLVTRYTGTTSPAFRGELTIAFFEVGIANEIQTPPSIAVGFPAFVVYEKLLEKMVGEPVPCDSVLLKTSNLFLTCGDAIREFEAPVIKTSFTDFYKSMDALLGCGFGVDNMVARLEQKEFFFREVEALDLGEVKSFEMDVAQSFLFAGLKVGFKEQNYEKEQGREEFNQGQFWTSPVKKTDSTLERVSIYRADQFGISILRRLTILDNVQKVDTESDNDIFVLQGSGVIEGEIHKLEKGSDFNYLAGISNVENAINVNLSPKRCLLRSGSFIGIGLDGFETDLLELGSSEKNVDLISEKDGRIVYESQAIAVSALGRRLFLPYLVRVTADLPKNSWSLIDQNLFGYFSFSYNSQRFRGYIEEASNDIGENTERDINLYFHPLTNLNNLIK